MMQMYHQMKKDEAGHLKIDIKDEEIGYGGSGSEVMSTTGTSGSTSS